MPDWERRRCAAASLALSFSSTFINYPTAQENVAVAAPVQTAPPVRPGAAGRLRREKLHRFPYELSGGERQRVAIARAMIHRPRIIFADEPTGLLDRHTGLQVIALLRAYRDQGSLIAVTHNPEILSEADLIVKMRDGQIVAMVDRVARQTWEVAA